MVDRVVLEVLDQLREMRELEGRRSVRGEQRRDPRSEVVDVGHLREDVVAQHEVGPARLLCKLPSELRAEELHDRRNAARDRGLCNVERRLDTEHGDALRQEVLEQVAVVRGELDDQAARPEPEPQEEEEEIAYAAPRFSISRFLMWAAAFIGVVACVSLFIYFTIGANPQEVVVPDVTGKPLAQAQALLAEKDLKAKLVEEYDSKVPAGQIISAAPAPGRTIKAGKEVLLFVSKGAQFASVPDVIGQSESDAREQIQRSGLVPGNVRREYSDTVAQGDVVSQDPKAAVQIAPMQKVNMIVSRGPKPLPAPPIDINPPEVSNNTPSVGDTGVENVPANEPTDADADQTGAGKLRRRNFQVGVAVPKDGEPHRVEIVISDSRNERTVYDREHGSGDSFSSPNLEGYGDEGSIRVYVDGELVKERLFSELDKSGGKPSGGTNR